MSADDPRVWAPDDAVAAGAHAASDGFALRVERDECGRQLRLWVTGEIDAAERDAIVAELDAGSTPTGIVIDLSEVTFMGSAGLSALIHACRQLEPQGHKVVLLNPSTPVVRLLDTCGLTRQFALQLL